MIKVNSYKADKLEIYQIQDPTSKSLTYIIGDKKYNKSIIIDPVEDMVDFYIEFNKKKNLQLKFTLETHLHADHISGSNKLIYLNKDCKYFMGEADNVKKITCNMLPNMSYLKLGNIKLKAIHTPGHTDDSYCYLLHSYLLTGDTLLINSTGRTDLKNGNAHLMYNSIFFKLLNLKDNITILPGHDYQGKYFTTIEEQKKSNPYLMVKNKKEFIVLKQKQKLSDPEKIVLSTKRNKQPLALYKAFVESC